MNTRDDTHHADTSVQTTTDAVGTGHVIKGEDVEPDGGVISLSERWASDDMQGVTFSPRAD
jgi:hypothetical protein